MRYLNFRTSLPPQLRGRFSGRFSKDTGITLLQEQGRVCFGTSGFCTHGKDCVMPDSLPRTVRLSSAA